MPGIANSDLRRNAVNASHWGAGTPARPHGMAHRCDAVQEYTPHPAPAGVRFERPNINYTTRWQIP
jgi:hypothetical protein